MQGFVVQVAADVVARRVDSLVHQHLAAGQLALEFLLDTRDVDFEYRAAEHAAGQVDEADLVVGHERQHQLEHAQHLVDVVGAVDAGGFVQRR